MDQKKKVISKVPKGTRDFLPIQMQIRRYAFETITSVFEAHGAVEIDTPVFELRETLLGKYGEEGGKLVYDLDDQGGELLSLRYDLTVPFARFLATHGIKKIKRFHIGKVYRRDNPSISQGRFREFFQCDFDIAGEYDLMVADAEMIKVIDQIIQKLDIGKYTIKVSNRKILDAMIQIAGIDPTLFKSVCSSIDKLDKQSWDEVKKELVEKKNVTEQQAEILSKMVLLKGEPFEMLEKINQLQLFSGSKLGEEALNEMRVLFTYLKQMNGIKNVSFDLSLARGLDYYTGIIQETVLEGANIGSISGGGRYDELVGMFSPVAIPCVGASIGIERVFTILEQKLSKETLRENPCDCIVAIIPSKNKDMNEQRFKVLDMLWNAGIKCDLLGKTNWNLRKQLDYANDAMIPYAIVIGEEEANQGIVKLKSLNEKTEVVVKLEELVETLKQKVGLPKTINKNIVTTGNKKQPEQKGQNPKEEKKKELSNEEKKANEQKKTNEQKKQPEEQRSEKVSAKVNSCMKIFYAKFQLEKEADLAKIEKHLIENDYLGGNSPNEEDFRVLSLLSNYPDKQKYPNLYEWFEWLNQFQSPTRQLYNNVPRKRPAKQQAPLTGKRILTLDVRVIKNEKKELIEELSKKIWKEVRIEGLIWQKQTQILPIDEKTFKLQLQCILKENVKVDDVVQLISALKNDVSQTEVLSLQNI